MRPSQCFLSSGRIHPLNKSVSDGFELLAASCCQTSGGQRLADLLGFYLASEWVKRCCKQCVGATDPEDVIFMLLEDLRQWKFASWRMLFCCLGDWVIHDR